MTQNLALVAAGGNLPSSAGRPDATIRHAFALIAQNKEITVTCISRFWNTPSHPIGSGPNYVNAAIALKTSISAENMLTFLHEIEAGLGRERRGARWQSRGLDLDLIAYGDAVMPDLTTHDEWRNLPPDRQALSAPKSLILPHPRMQDRAFVLVPLAEVAPTWCHPRLNRNVVQMLSDLPPSARADITPVTT